MDVETRFVAKIRDYNVIETRIINGDKTIDVFYNIRNKDGQVVGERFDNSKEPMNLLLDEQKYKELEKN